MERQKRLHIITYGCQMNIHDSEKIAGLLQPEYQLTPNPEDADFILVNTCSIREKAEHKLYSKLGQLKPLKALNPDLIIGVCGCVAQQEGENILKKSPSVDLVFGTNTIPKLPGLLKVLWEGRNNLESPALSEYSTSDIMVVRPRRPVRVVDLSEADWQEPDANVVRECSFKAYITVMRGCDKFCTFCVVPFTRGREESRPSDDIIKEAQWLADQGVIEIMLLGQNVTSYGKRIMSQGERIREDVKFPELLARLNEVEGLQRIRYTTPHPQDLSDDLIAAVREFPKVCEHIHLPVQAGSSKVLKNMNRRYTKEHYLERIHRLKEEVPGIAITTDIIVGFPGESEEDFQDTLEVMEVAQYDSCFAFKYSDRPNTKSPHLPNPVPEEVKEERLQRVLDLQKTMSLKKNKSFVGQVKEVLVDEINPKFAGMVTGRTRTNHIVSLPGTPELLGQLIKVEITEVYPFRLAGQRIE
jgi:tRNA-2-methylthio-N6-dimethylallyladenosine synthase